jgi:hypothetical protein
MIEGPERLQKSRFLIAAIRIRDATTLMASLQGFRGVRGITGSMN